MDTETVVGIIVVVLIVAFVWWSIKKDSGSPESHPGTGSKSSKKTTNLLK